MIKFFQSIHQCLSCDLQLYTCITNGKLFFQKWCKINIVWKIGKWSSLHRSDKGWVHYLNLLVLGKSFTSDKGGIKISLSFYLNASFSDQLNARIAESLKHVVDGRAVHLCDGWWHFMHPGLHNRSPPEGWRLHVNHTTSRHLNKKLDSDLVTVLTSNEGFGSFSHSDC